MQLAKHLTIAFCFLFLLSAAANAQRPEHRLTPTGLSLEVIYYKDTPPAFQVVQPDGGKPSGAWYGRFGTLPGWQLPAGELPVRAINVVPRLEGDTVRINVSVFQGVEFHDRETVVGIYHLREGESVSVTELKRFGVEPFRIGVGRNAPFVPSLPVVKSLGKSLDVVAIEPVNSTLPSYKLTVHNLSDKNISGLRIDTYNAGRISLTSMPHGEEGLPLINSGAFYESNQPIATQPRPTANGYSAEPTAAQETIISAVIFADGSYEGDSARAAEFRALILGRKLALTRLLPVFASVDEASFKDKDRSTQLRAFRESIVAIPEEAAEETLSQLRGEFPGLDQKKQAEFKRRIESAVHYLKRDLLKELDTFEATPESDVHGWLEKTGERYRSWLARL